MPIKDARGHVVPTGTDAANRESLLALSRSIPSIRTVSSEVAAGKHIEELKAVGVRPSASDPVFVWRSDLGALMQWDGTRWVTQSLLLGSLQIEGDNGIALSHTGAPAMMIKTGRMSSYTSNAYGNGYMSTILFRTPFPHDCLTVNVTPIYRQGKYMFTSPTAPQVDDISRSQFRVVYPGETQTAPHSFMWVAVGW